MPAGDANVTMTRGMGKIQIETASADETRDLGRRLAKKLRASDIICFYGELGTGKTTMIKGIADGLKVVADYVHSPTFTLMNVYDHGRIPLYHFDMYRIEQPEQLFDIGYEEFLYGSGVAVVEWSERFGPFLPKERLDIYLTHKTENRRGVRIKAVGERYEQVAAGFSARPIHSKQ